MSPDTLEYVLEELRIANEALRSRSEELERERKRADDANRAKSTFLANLSHELRTPLNAIGGYVQLMELGVHGPLSQEQRDVLGRIQYAHRHLLGLINDVLNLSRIEAGRVEYRLENVSLREVLHEVVPMVEPQIGAKGVSYSVNIPEEVFVRADREKLLQIVINLLSNAIKFTPRGGHISSIQDFSTRSTESSSCASSTRASAFLANGLKAFSNRSFSLVIRDRVRGPGSDWQLAEILRAEWGGTSVSEAPPGPDRCLR